jgi:DNA polymerase-1
MYKAIKKTPEQVKNLGITERIFGLLKDGEEEAIFSKTLATIRRDAPIKFELPQMSWKQTVAPDSVAEFFLTMEFKSLQNRFLSVLKGEKAVEPKTKEEKKEADKAKVESYSDEDREKVEKAKIALWLLNSELTNPSVEDILNYKNSKNLDEALAQLESDIEKENLEYVYKEIEVPIIPIIDSMEKLGIKVDVEYLKKLSKEYHTDLSKIEKTIWKMAGREFNINSPKQLGEVIYDEMGLSVKGMKKSAGGARSTRESELEKIKDLHPIVEEILRYRELQKLLSTYIDTIPNQVGSDGRLHARFIQTGSSTGRFSSNEPNLQNVPIKTEKGKNIRNAFIAEKGYVLASFDYSQIELRACALMSQDSYFIKVFKEGKDIHTAVAMKVFNVDEENVTADMRRRAKVINFGILYGMGVTALRQNLGTDRKEAQEFYDNYFAQFPTIAAYLESIKDFAKKHGYTQTLFGRKRYFPGIKSPLPFIRAMAERMATNAPIQGTATADIIKIGMKKAEDNLAEAGLHNDARLLLQVHDELVYEIKKEKLATAMKIIENAMKNAIPNEFLENIEPVPLLVSSGYGQTWNDLK